MEIVVVVRTELLLVLQVSQSQQDRPEKKSSFKKRSLSPEKKNGEYVSHDDYEEYNGGC